MSNSDAKQGESASLGLTVKKSENLSEWYQQVVLKAGFADYSPVGGCMVYMPWGYAIWEHIRGYLDSELRKLGHQNAYFPLLIPESLLKLESDHFAGFMPEVAWVEHGGDEKLQERLAIRPTSETIMYYMYAKWIKSHRDLPLLLNQWNNVVRWDTKSTRLFLRTREFLWQEGHTAHATKEEAEKEVFTILGIYERLLRDALALPSIVGLKSEGEKFPGALFTATLEVLMPDGKAVQAGTSHHLGQNFAKVFDIRFLTEQQTKEYVWQTSWGVSTRLIGSLLMVHGDDKGAIIPPRVAPVQVVIVPIYYSEQDAATVTVKAKSVAQRLEAAGLRVKVDDRADKTPGWKFNEWELKGVPLRVEIGPRDVVKDQAVLARRDTREKIQVKLEELETRVQALLDDIHATLLKRAEDHLVRNQWDIEDYEQFKRVLEEKGGFLRASWCGYLDCETTIKNETGATVRVIPLNQKPKHEKCFRCERKATKLAYFARSY
ncbi:proline--tRNA ligase [Candidatus Marsarchaeota G2 archaeon OSP_D]|jgi:prolyl-tRNA synthetase|uniref:Proline--tRNA ligase n=6 Tax=Candidatus Marsarchaeota group 2 TaxID=2203771 RepID=A0A2R6BB85_9ARCH|nr:MAG: proline--tRNA ligase [Candidatus Marsarchaeota G2 archaeon OSP_D]PSN92721.1 MAG: proline--tRNA ligase [Candidatus Marsarchaeota G2 archaeon ECH_B_SAG-M15]PSN95924.1 MAG: proline--tRNA ligase [Candidatus Marsarchaeota G2 archaeon ECH_B_2]PSO00700.1 MAG: proline--tRNA ligase [Candidatus Marsarchaeota G2 archaeon ECH_B_3]PSO02574.1 MAG: proline--tRNA ligase [Candidatus Marsarchaeota G2 archaeon ECH_B_1]